MLLRQDESSSFNKVLTAEVILAAAPNSNKSLESAAFNAPNEDQSEINKQGAISMADSFGISRIPSVQQPGHHSIASNVVTAIASE